MRLFGDRPVFGGLWDSAWALLIATNLFWAGNIVLARGLAGQVPPVALAYLRWTGAFLVAVGIAWPGLKRDWPVMLRHWKMMLLLSATGKVTVDAEGVPEGRITIRAKNWKGMVAVAVTLGLVRPELAPTVQNMLAELAKGSPDPDVVELPLEFQKGWMSLGPLPVGAAPRLR